MRLTNGTTAKDFSIKDINGNTINLKDYKGKKVLLWFYRYASCPVCNLRAMELLEYKNIFDDNNLHMIGFFQSPRSSMLKYIGKNDLPFPIIPDPDWNVYKLYGVESSLTGFLKGMVLRIPRIIKAIKNGFNIGETDGDMKTVPADFLINEEGIIEKAYYGNDIGDHMEIDEIVNWSKS